MGSTSQRKVPKALEGRYLGAPRTFWSDQRGRAWHVTVHLARVGPRIECVGIFFGSFNDGEAHPAGPFHVLDSTVWRQFKPGEETLDAIGQLVETGQVNLERSDTTEEVRAVISQVLAQVPASPAARRQGRKLHWTPERLNDVFYVARSAREIRADPFESVNDHFKLGNYDYARKLVYRADREALSSPKRKDK